MPTIASAVGGGNAGVVTTSAGSGVGGFADGTVSSVQFAGLEGVAVDSSGTVYVADYNNLPYS